MTSIRGIIGIAGNPAIILPSPADIMALSCAEAEPLAPADADRPALAPRPSEAPALKPALPLALALAPRPALAEAEAPAEAPAEGLSAPRAEVSCAGLSEARAAWRLEKCASRQHIHAHGPFDGRKSRQQLGNRGK